MPPWSNAWAEWRNRRLADAGFRRRLQRLPLVRRVARARADDLFETTAAFVNSQVLAACLELDLLDRLDGAPARAEDLAGALDVDAERLLRLLEAAAALQLLERRPRGAWGLGPQGAVLASDPGLRAMSLHHRALYADLAEPVKLLRRDGPPTHLSRLWPYAGSDSPSELEAEETARYTALMAESQRMVADQVLDAFDFAPHRRLLDVGGGSGAFLAAVGEAHPDLQLDLFDLPGVVAQAGARLAAAGLDDRVRLHGGDFHRDPFPEGPDLISLVRIAHDHDDPAVAALLRKVHEALPPGGTLLLAEPMAAGRRLGGTLGNYFRFYLMAMGSGRPRSPGELKKMLVAAGFSRIRRHRTPIPTICSVLSAEKGTRKA